jgi:hypothetical protein
MGRLGQGAALRKKEIKGLGRPWKRRGNKEKKESGLLADLAQQAVLDLKILFLFLFQT